MFENVRYLSAIYNVTQQQNRLDEAVRSLRTDFLENVVGRIVSQLFSKVIESCRATFEIYFYLFRTFQEKDKLWRYSVVLWIWFLTEPHRMMHAIDEVKKAAAGVIRPGGGLQRK